MKFNYERLRERIQRMHGSVSVFATAANMTTEHVYNLLCSVIYWSMSEIDTACRVLHLPADSIPVFFFDTIN